MNCKQKNQTDPQKAKKTKADRNSKLPCYTTEMGVPGKTKKQENFNPSTTKDMETLLDYKKQPMTNKDCKVVLKEMEK